MSEKRTSEDIYIVPGDIVSGLEPTELVEIRRIAPLGSKTLVEGIGVQSRREIKRPLTIEELSSLIKIRGKVHTFKGDSGTFLLGAEAERIRIAHQFDPLFAVNSSIVYPLPHQVEAVYRYLLPLPRIRFLLGSEYEDLTEDEREHTDRRIFRQVLTDDPEKVEEEREEVERLFHLAESLKHHKEAKFAELLEETESGSAIQADSVSG